LSRLLQGAAFGAIAIVVFGFNWGGWVLGSTAAKESDERAKAAVVAVLAPICVDKFQNAADAPSKLIELKKVSSYRQGSFVEDGGWATLPGNDKAESGVARACAKLLGDL
jgi:hypothetical protein